MNPLVLVRHADAVGRGALEDDSARPLSRRGRRRAAALVPRLAGLLGTGGPWPTPGPAPAAPSVPAVLSSPALRCRQTVEPLARHLGTEVRSVAWLAEGEPASPALRRLVEATGRAPVVACTHGDVLGDLLRLLVLRGAPQPTGGVPKAGSWVVTFDGDRPVDLRHIPPPG